MVEDAFSALWPVKEQDNQDVLNWRKLLHAGELKLVPGKKSWSPAIAELLVCSPGGLYPGSAHTHVGSRERLVLLAGWVGASWVVLVPCPRGGWQTLA